MDDCILWTRATNGRGYGQVRRSGRLIGAHRVAYEDAYGPIPAGESVLHRCDQSLCVNPAHLFLGSQDDNMADRNAKRRQAVGERVGTSRLTADQVREIRDRASRGERPVDLGPLFGIRRQTVSQIVNRTRWRHL